MAILKVPYNGEWAIIESPSAVKFTEQTLSDAEKARARANIGAVTADEVSITVDDALSTTSANPVQNKVVNAAIENLSNLVGETPVPEQISIAIANNLIGAPGTGTNAEIFNATSGTIQNVASGSYAHAEGYSTAAEANYTHAEGYNTDAKKDAAHAEGDSTVANSKASHTEGYRTTTLGYAAHAEGHSNAVCPTDIAYGTDNADVIAAWNTNKFALAKGYGAHSEGSSSLALGDYSHAEGYRSIASGESAHSEGDTTVASGNRAHAEGYQTTASANFTHAEGGSTAASGQYAHAEGNGAIASGAISHAEGSITRAKGYAAHAEGSNTTSIGQSSHAEGQSTYKAPDTITSSTTKANIIAEHKNTKFTLANGKGAHTEGYDTLSLGEASHAEGYRSIASGDYAHAEGADTVASGMRSHAEGYGTIASSTNQHVQGKYNIEDATAQYAHIVGNGSTAADPSNAHTLDWDGNAWFAGDVTVGTGKKTLATTEYVDNAVATSSPNIEVDKTLSIEGMAADAKTTGEALAATEPKIYKQNIEPTDAPIGALWVDTSEDGVIETPDGVRQGNFDTLHVAGDAEIGGNLTFLNGSPFAPNGYGLGSDAGMPLGSSDDLNSVYKSGWYTCDGVLNSPVKYGTCLVLARNVDNTCQVFFGYASDEQVNQNILIRWRLRDGDWREWEWMNPPMHIGVEYRTTKRYNGRAVYKKLVTITSSIAAKATMLVPHGISDIESVLSVVCFRDRYTLPYEDPSGYTTFVSYCDDTNIGVVNNGGAWTESRTWNFIVSYTKD